MPNLIHSLDSANIQLLVDKIDSAHCPLYTVHDCFATVPQSMKLLEKEVKNAFLDLYFSDTGFLVKLHEEFIKRVSENRQIKNKIDPDTGDTVEFVVIENKKYLIPSLPKTARDQKLSQMFIEGMHTSNFFIS